jgi:hypothetical protein
LSLIGNDQRNHAVRRAVGTQGIQAHRAMRADKTDQSFNAIIISRPPPIRKCAVSEHMKT